MRKLFLFFALFMAILPSCKEVDKLTQFDLPVNQQFTLPGSLPVMNGFSFSTPDVETNYMSYFEMFNINTELVESICIKSATFKINKPQTADFSFLKSVEVYISADGLEPVLMASKKDVNTNVGNSLNLDVDSKVNLKDYVTKNNIKLNVKVTTVKATTEEYVVDTKLIFGVDAKVMGL